MKGNDVVKNSFQKIKNYEQNLFDFSGYIEGNNIMKGDVNVIVTDGFTGNVVLKTLQGVAKLQQDLISKSLKENLFKPLLIPVKNAISPVKRMLNPNSTNGSYLLGVNGLVIIGHGSSNSEAIKNALLFTSRAVEKRFINKFTEVSSEL